MSPLFVGFIGTVCGLVCGTCLGALLSTARRKQQPAQAGKIQDTDLVEILAALSKPCLLLDALDSVVWASPEVLTYGVVHTTVLTHPRLRIAVSKARRTGQHEEQFALDRAENVLSARASMLSDGNMLIFLEDRTEVVKAQAVRNDFVANVSHELKTPIGAISLLAEAVASSAEDTTAVRRFAGRLHRESERLAALVQDIIDFSRLQGANIVQRGKPVDVASALAEATELVALQAEAKNIMLVIETEPLDVFGDRELLITAFRNLIENAIRYSPENTTVGIGTGSKDGFVRVMVSDQGEGIAVEEQERIFERFYRADAARSRQTGGTGLGLSIVKHVVSQHGGEVTVWSCLGRGTTFTVSLPQMVKEAETTAGTEKGRHE